MLGQRLGASLQAAKVLAVESLTISVSLGLLAWLYWSAPTLLESIEPRAQQGILLTGMGSIRAVCLAGLAALNVTIAVAMVWARGKLQSVQHLEWFCLGAG